MSEVTYMSYRIEYDSVLGKYEVRRNKSWKLFLLPAISCIVLLLAFSPHIRELLQTILIPGEDAVTVLAFQTMANDLRSGAGLYEALFDFCSMVLHGV